MSKANKTLKSEQRIKLTVQTVVELAAQQNPSDISTTAIAQRMGVTQGAIFRHFPSKEAILESVMSWVAKQLMSRVEKAAQREQSACKALEAMFMAHTRFVSKHPGVPRMIFGELQSTQESLPKRMVKNLINEYREKLHYYFVQGQSQNELPINLDTQAAAALFVGSIQGLVMQSLLANDPQLIERHAQAVWQLYLAGIQGNNHV